MRTFTNRPLTGWVTLVLVAALGACAPDEVPTAPNLGSPQTPSPTPGRRSGEGYSSRGELGRGYVLDRAGHPMQVTYEVHNGVAIWEGDIELGKVSEVSTTPAGARPLVRGWISAKGAKELPANVQATVVIDGDGFRWPGGVVPYVIDGGLPNQTRVAEAITMIESRTGGVTFVPRMGQADYVKFVANDGCSSPIGRKGGEQTIKLADGCGAGSTAHEMLHALGMFHEQSRCDRDNYVEIQFDNIADSLEFNFIKHCDDATDLTDLYDFGSLMHYSLMAFSDNGQPTIKLRSGVTYDGTIGQTDSLSSLDRFTINFLYGLNNKPPVPVIGPLAASYDEGSEVPFDATGSTDADDKVLTFRWTFDDGSCLFLPGPAECRQAQTKHVFANDGGYQVALYVWDGYEEEVTDKVVTIKNVAPKIDMNTNATGEIFPADEGDEFKHSGSFEDPGADFWQATVNYGDGGGSQALLLVGKSFALKHTYADNGFYTIGVSVKDDDETSTASGKLEVRNVKPKVNAGADQTLTSGQSFNFSGSFSDPGLLDSPWSWKIDWGVATPTTGSTNTQGAIASSNKFCGAGTYNVVLSVTDKDNGTGTDDAQITVGYVSVGVSIMPGSSPTSISLKKSGSLPVAILSSPTFDARLVNVASIRIGNEQGTDTPVDQQKGRFQSRVDDVNGDGRPDLVVQFSVPLMSSNGDLSQATTSLAVRGFQGNDSCINFRGVGSIRVVP